tara:strand:- start:379 stop:1368 length:990 start_codon:yes stop_codon:yes gene_type:complete
MADVKPLKIDYDGDGVPSGIGEFQSGDTIAGSIVDLSISELTDVSSTIAPVNNDVLVYNGSLWTAASSLTVGDLTVSGDLSGTGNIGVVGQIMCGQTGPGTADLNIVDDNSDATVEINSGANYDSKIQFRENNAWRCDVLWDGGDNDFHIITYTGDINLRPAGGYGVLVEGNLSATGSLSATTPAPYLWLRSAADGTAATEQYFGSGTGTLTVNQSGFTNASSTIFTNGYVEIPETGVYEIYAKIGGNVTASPTTVSVQIITTTGWGGTESVLALGTQVIRTNIDPHQAVCDYIGTFAAGTKVAIKLTADGSNTVKPERYASVSFKKIG